MDCGFVVCSVDMKGAYHLIDLIVPFNEDFQNMYSFLRDQNGVLTTLEGMMPAGMFVGGIFLKTTTLDDMYMEDKDIINKMKEIFDESISETEKHPLFYIVSTNQDLVVHLCNVSDESMVKQNEFDVIKTNKSEDKFESICEVLGKNYLQLEASFKLSFMALNDPANSKEMLLIQSINKFLQNPQICFTLVKEDTKFLLMGPKYKRRTPTSQIGAIKIDNGCKFVMSERQDLPVESEESYEWPSSNDNPIGETVPVIQIKRGMCHYYEYIISTSIGLLLPPLQYPLNETEVYETLIKSIKTHINLLLFFYKEKGLPQNHRSESALFLFPQFKYPLSCVKNFETDWSVTEMFKKLFGLKTALNILSSPFLYCNRNVKYANLLISPHKGLKANIDGIVSKVRGKYVYFHYNCDNLDDRGWGCAYRAFQTIYSWFVINGQCLDKEVPGIKKLQQKLVELGDKPSDFVGSRTWVGSIEIGILLQSMLGKTYKLLQLVSAEQHFEIMRELVYHFENRNCPVMICGKNMAHNILGVALCEDTGMFKLLIADPHYVGPDDAKNAASKGGIGWKGSKFLDKNSTFNILLPLTYE